MSFSSRLKNASSNRLAGTPYLITPPGSGIASKTSTSNPCLASSAAQLKPAGPEPITATFVPLAGLFSRGEKSMFQLCSIRARWIAPILMGSPMPVALHSFSHSSGVGQSTPQAPPRMLFCLIVLMAPVTFFSRSFLINVPGSVFAGHPAEQGASWQRRQRFASAIACCMEKPFSMVLKSFDKLKVYPPSKRP